MGHSIKISDQVYQDLRQLQGVRETYSDVIERLLAIVRPIQEASKILGPSHFLKGDLSPETRKMVEYAQAKNERR